MRGLGDRDFCPSALVLDVSLLSGYMSFRIDIIRVVNNCLIAFVTEDPDGVSSFCMLSVRCFELAVNTPDVRNSGPSCLSLSS